MPRDIPLGNGQLLVTFDKDYQIRDVYFPHVGQENHGGGRPFRFGFFVDGQLAWTSDTSWKLRLRYLRETLCTSVSLANNVLRLAVRCHDVVDSQRPILIRSINVRNLVNTPRDVTVFAHQGFNLFGTKLGETAYFDPELASLIHYRTKRYFLATFLRDDQPAIDQYATGTSGFAGAEGTWRDAEDGRLSGNAIAQGAVDSTMAATLHLPPFSGRQIFMVLIAGKSREELIEHLNAVKQHTARQMIESNIAYWKLWAGGTNINFGNLPPRIVDLFKRSLLIIRTQTDNNGAVVAANDSDVLQFSRDTYSYLWPRDAALAAHAMDLAGFSDVARWFYSLAGRIITDEGYFLHKYNPDGSPASSWHPWVSNGQRQLPIQEDETALVIWALWRHYFRYRDIEYVRPLWPKLITKAADFMVNFRDPATHLPAPSYDLWEERYGIHAFTVAAVYGGLHAARNFAICLGDQQRAQKYEQAARDIQQAAATYLYSSSAGRFVRRIYYTHDGAMQEDPAVDSSLHGIYRFGLFDVNDRRVSATMRAIEDRLWVKTPVGGVARYDDDHYWGNDNHRRGVPGNPWFICTLWLAQYLIAKADSVDQLKQALPIFEWVAAHALESGVLAEQVDPHSSEPLSVSPLTWSHAELVTAVINYLEKLERLQLCHTCGQSVYRMRRHWPTQVKVESLLEKYQPGNGSAGSDVTAIAQFQDDSRRVTIAVNQRDCIGCYVCTISCKRDILTVRNDKAYIKTADVTKCTLDRECERCCPVNALSIRTEPVRQDKTFPA